MESSCAFDGGDAPDDTLCVLQEESTPTEPGEHTRVVLLEVDYTAEEIEVLARKAIVLGPGLPEKTVSDSK